MNAHIVFSTFRHAERPSKLDLRIQGKTLYYTVLYCHAPGREESHGSERGVDLFELLRRAVLEKWKLSHNILYKDLIVKHVYIVVSLSYIFHYILCLNISSVFLHCHYQEVLQFSESIQLFF